MAENSPKSSIEDVQNSEDTRRIAIDRVGIKGIRHPVSVIGRQGQTVPTVATFDMYVNLPHDQKGTHMSRFVELLNESVETLDTHEFLRVVAEMTRRLEASRGYLNASFPYFIRKRAPVTGAASYLDYEVSLIGEWAAEASSLLLKLVVPVTSLCPCSKKISDYGAHNQRSHVTLTVQTREPVWLEDLIDLIEREASCEIFGLLKRADEKYVTERAYNNPKFVEDIVRDIANDLNRDARIVYYKLETENFESIHNHSAYATIERRKGD
ncbi:GTP cyclohydrolase FolE2 [Methylococcus sp. EFPC2]|uniref:GTP cyclohydrolase FolE2 n=1 Tax=Methylococcus sp. EFPC2 TaxID=2812648 RepID=UPI001967ACDE|nr:GTP cyclohydrolase FolE2 [Methylococcus sp. EFPC2]QSA98888.1 GTP cyclohydrolase I FolE2 [Methylococcus sp. EFPC2]